jgi:hypothetical protein
MMANLIAAVATVQGAELSDVTDGSNEKTEKALIKLLICVYECIEV